MSLAKIVPEALDEFVSAREALLELSKEVSAEDLQLFYQIALIGRKDLPLSPDARNGFEMIMLRMLAFRPVSADTGHASHRAVQQSAGQQDAGRQTGANTPVRSQTQTQAYSNAKVPVQTTVQATTQAAAAVNKIAEPEPASVAPINAPGNTRGSAGSVASGSKEIIEWREIVISLGLGGLVKQLAVNCAVKQRDGNKIILQIASGHRNLINPKAKQRLQQALGEYFDIDAQLDIEVVNKIEAESPAQTTQRETVQRQQQAESSINEDGFVRSLKENFNAEIIPGSVKPVT
jgi:DNA polymerase-3 subunit gamma/tau